MNILLTILDLPTLLLISLFRHTIDIIYCKAIRLYVNNKGVILLEKNPERAKVISYGN